MAYWWRSAFDRPSRLLAGLADISYPLYVVHGVAGYAVIRVLLDRGVPAVAAVLLALMAALAVARMLHVTVERSTQRLGRRMARMIDRHIGSAAILDVSKPTTAMISRS